MARIDRTGNRKSREQRKQFEVPELGYLYNLQKYLPKRVVFVVS